MSIFLCITGRTQESEAEVWGLTNPPWHDSAPDPKEWAIAPDGQGLFLWSDWRANYESGVEEEYDITGADIEGEIPRALWGGSLYRNGPGNFERGDERVKHVLDGDGLASLFYFPPGGGRVRFVSRFVRTEEFVAEVCDMRSCGAPRCGGGQVWATREGLAEVCCGSLTYTCPLQALGLHPQPLGPRVPQWWSLCNMKWDASPISFLWPL